MPEDNAEVRAENNKVVTITIAEKSESDRTEGTSPNTFVIENGSQILTITIAE
jgi:hypothetical protein